jgi:hypothetical protein
MSKVTALQIEVLEEFCAVAVAGTDSEAAAAGLQIVTRTRHRSPAARRRDQERRRAHRAALRAFLLTVEGEVEETCPVCHRVFRVPRGKRGWPQVYCERKCAVVAAWRAKKAREARGG